MKRFYSFLFIFIVAVLAVAIGSLIPLNAQDADTISQQLNQTLAEHQANDSLTQYIFLNNFQICLLMFVPIIGPALGMLILFQTGVALSAISMSQGFPVVLGWLSLVVTPVFWLEFVAYSIAMTASIWLFRRLMQHRWRELKWTAIAIGICAALLAIGAVVEVWIINFAG